MYKHLLREQCIYSILMYLYDQLHLLGELLLFQRLKCLSIRISESVRPVFIHMSQISRHTAPVLSSIALVYISVTWEGGEGEGKEKNWVCVCVFVYVHVKQSQRAVKCDVICAIEGETSFILAFIALHFCLAELRSLLWVCGCVSVELNAPLKKFL